MAKPAKKTAYRPAAERSNERCVIGWISPGQTSMFFTTSLNLMSLRDMAVDRHLVNIIPQHSGVNIAHSRNDITRQFLDDNTEAEWLLWIDSDMEFEPETMHRLIESAHPVDRPIVGALCFGEDAEIGLFPTCYKIQQDPNGNPKCIRLGTYPQDTMFEVFATGCAFLLIHRTVLEAMREADFNETFPFFQELEMFGKPVGEDIAFCARARSLGFPVFVNTSIAVGHHKSHILTEKMFLEQQGKREFPLPATEWVQVIVPVMGRPQNAQRFMDSLRASTGMADAWAVCDRDDADTKQAWIDAGATVLECDFPGGGTFAQKVNLAALDMDTPWVFIVGDDVIFRPGWLDYAQTAARDRFHVIGTNDLGLERVMLGQHGIHLLIRRTYIDGVGASWDGPGLICHEGYRHWFVDDEIVTAAKQRDVWTSARQSIVEHMHPFWGKADEDATYIKGQASRFEDEALFRKRLAEHSWQNDEDDAS